MNVIYALYNDPQSAQAAVDTLRLHSTELSITTNQILIASGEPYSGYEFTDSHATNKPYRWAALGGVIGGTLGYLLTTFSQKTYPIFTGGMPLSPGWTNGIIIYEMTMLGAILTTLIVLLIGAGLPNFKGVITDPEIGSGKILVGVVDPLPSAHPKIEEYFQATGQTEIKHFKT